MVVGQADDKLAGLGLEAPQTTQVCAALAKLGVPIAGDILTIDDMVEAICKVKQ
jgi:hypothetical protein